ncbi:SDR family oxidoreductase [Campylobacterota bacterium]
MKTPINRQTILLTGSTGYIGRRLKHQLLKDDNLKLKLLVRHANSLADNIRKDTEVFEGSTFDQNILEEAMKDVDVAYYLIHSLGHDNYAELDRKSAKNFREAAIKAGVKKIIYLGGLGVINEDTSEHLRSRIETGEVLSERPEEIDVIWFRAGVIIGSGSASFEIIRNLIQKLPIMITPKWVRTKAQPIGVEDVIDYLEHAKEDTLTGSHTIDIGSEELCYQEMMVQCAEVMGLKRFIIPVPFLSVGLSSYWLNIFTPVPFSVAASLIKGVRCEVIVQNDNAKKLLSDIHPSSFKQSIANALLEAEENQVISRWSDGGHDVWEMDHKNSIDKAVFIDRQILPLENLSASDVHRSYIGIGGKNGWFSYDWLWEIRGLVDKLAGGVGLNRGRRSQDDLRIGDSLDFWKVIDVQHNERLLLYAQMRVPGKAWLEFKIHDGMLIQSAYFLPKGVLGRLYWYALVPIHYLVFRDMIRSVLKKARTIDHKIQS